MFRTISSATEQKRPDAREALGLGEIAARYGLSIGFVRLEVARQNLKVRHLGRRVIVLRPDLERWLNGGER
jgi:hypothetical protein